MGEPCVHDGFTDTCPWCLADGFQTEIERLRAAQEVMLDDLAALLRALGLGDHTRPETPHAVMLSAIAEVERLRTERRPCLYCKDQEEFRRQAEARLTRVVAKLEEKLAILARGFCSPTFDREDVAIMLRDALAAAQPEEDTFDARLRRSWLPAAQPEEEK